jgi:hypothetical protein
LLTLYILFTLYFPNPYTCPHFHPYFPKLQAYMRF